MATTTEVEIFIVIDDCGDKAFGNSQDEAFERYQEEIGCTDRATRVVCLNLDVALPTVQTVKGSIPLDAAGPIALAVA